MVQEMQSEDGTLTGDKLQTAVDDIQQSVDAFIAKHPASPVVHWLFVYHWSTQDVNILKSGLVI